MAMYQRKSRKTGMTRTTTTRTSTGTRVSQSTKTGTLTVSTSSDGRGNTRVTMTRRRGDGWIDRTSKTVSRNKPVKLGQHPKVNVYKEKPEKRSKIYYSKSNSGTYRPLTKKDYVLFVMLFLFMVTIFAWDDIKHSHAQTPPSVSAQVRVIPIAPEGEEVKPILTEAIEASEELLKKED